MQITRAGDIGALVRQRRRELGLTQHQLAANLRVSQKYISHLEAGKDTLRMGHALRVLKFLGATLTVQFEKDPRRTERTERKKPRISIDSIVDG